MADHYFTNKPVAEHDYQEFSRAFHGRTFHFVTDSGVFSRDRIDFGSTLLIEHMIVPSDGEVLDMGCGYGPIGMVAAHLAPKGRIVMVDRNERAVELANENIRKNGISNAVAIVSDLFAAVSPEQRFDRIFTNPPVRAGKQVVYNIFEQAKNYLKENGELWVVMQKKQGADSALRKLRDEYGQVEEMAKSKGFRVYRAVKLSYNQKDIDIKN